MELAANIDAEVKQLKDHIYRIAWHMRGGVSAHDLLWNLSYEDREIMSAIMKDNIEATNKSGMPLL